MRLRDVRFRPHRRQVQHLKVHTLIKLESDEVTMIAVATRHNKSAACPHHTRRVVTIIWAIVRGGDVQPLFRASSPCTATPDCEGFYKRASKGQAKSALPYLNESGIIRTVNRYPTQLGKIYYDARSRAANTGSFGVTKALKFTKLGTYEVIPRV